MSTTAAALVWILYRVFERHVSLEHPALAVLIVAVAVSIAAISVATFLLEGLGCVEMNLCNGVLGDFEGRSFDLEYLAGDLKWCS